MRTERPAFKQKLPEVMSGVLIPSQPHLLTEIRTASPDIQAMARVIKSDPGISASILRTVNSSSYGLKSTIVSIEQATVLLGIDAVTNIATGRLLRSSSMGDEGEADALQGFWRSAEDVAMCAAAVVQNLGFGSPDEAYILGLFHDCGIPLMRRKFASYLSILDEAYSKSDQDIFRTEDQHFHSNHAVIGYLVAKNWRLPDTISNVIRDHHDTERISGKIRGESAEADILLLILKMAEHIAGLHLTLGHQIDDYEWERIKSLVFEYFGISEPDFDDIRDNVRERVGL